MEKIISVKEDTFGSDAYSGYAGFIILTDKQEIKFGISDYQSCCENWGYFSSEDDYKEFIGAELLGIETVDTVLNVESFKTLSVEIGDCIFINVKTSKGLLQFAVYNEHNGYYGHGVKLISNQLTFDDGI